MLQLFLRREQRGMARFQFAEIAAQPGFRAFHAENIGDAGDKLARGRGAGERAIRRVLFNQPLGRVVIVGNQQNMRRVGVALGFEAAAEFRAALPRKRHADENNGGMTRANNEKGFLFRRDGDGVMPGLLQRPRKR